MHVCFFNRSYWPDTGATGQLLTELAEDLVARHDVRVTVVTGYPVRGPHTLRAREERNGVSIVRAAGTVRDPSRFTGRAINYLTYFLSAWLAAWRITDADVVVAMTDPPIIGLAGLQAVRRSHGRFVFLCQDVFPEVAALVQDFHSSLVNRGLEMVGRHLVRKADRIIALGDTMQRRLVVGKGADPAKIDIIHNWADCEALHPAPKDNPFSRRHALDAAFVVMHAGNIGLSQNLGTVLDAAEALRDQPGIQFVFVGDGSSRAALQREAHDRGLSAVRFLPYQPRAEMVHSYAAADVFIVSLKEGLAGHIVPSKVYSILASGRPYIAAVEDDSEVAAITRQCQCGVVVAPGDGQALAAHIRRLHSDAALAKAMGERARQAGLSFDRRVQVARYAALLRRVASSVADVHAAA